jgi:hypothetical protein
MPVQRLKVALLPLDKLCSGNVTNSGEIIATAESLSHQATGRIICKEDSEMKSAIKFKYET